MKMSSDADKKSEYDQLVEKSLEHKAFGEYIKSRMRLYQHLKIPTEETCDMEKRLERSCALIRKIGGPDLKMIQGFRHGYRRPSVSVATGKIIRILVLIESFRQRCLDDREKAYWKPFYVICDSLEDQELIAEKLMNRGFSVVLNTQTPTWTQADYAVLNTTQSFKTRLWIRQEMGFIYIGYIRDLFGITDGEDLPNIKDISNPENSAEEFFMYRFLKGNVLEINPT